VLDSRLEIGNSTMGYDSKPILREIKLSIAS
jgi:hypothetical protein